MVDGQQFGANAPGALNTRIGWSMLLAGIGFAAFLDPMVFAERLEPALADDPWWPWRHAQGVLLAMGLAQLAAGYALQRDAFELHASKPGSVLTGLGAGVYATGYLLAIVTPFSRWLILMGSGLNLVGFGLLATAVRGGTRRSATRVVMVVICFGMTLDMAMGLLLVVPGLSAAQLLGADDAISLRMIRLARVASIALSVITLLSFDLTRTGDQSRRLGNLACRLFLIGAVGMPSVLVLSGTVWLPLKYLLTIPALSVSAGAILATLVTWKQEPKVQRNGWLLLSVSVVAGLTIGMYAFDGPLPAPDGMDHYQALARHVVRIAHAYAIVLALVLLFLAARIRRWHQARGLSAPATATWASCACALTPIALLVVLVPNSPLWPISIGPAVLVLATLGVLASLARRS